MADNSSSDLAGTIRICLIDDKKKLASSVKLIEDFDRCIGIHQGSRFRRGYQQYFIGNTGKEENDVTHSRAGVK